MPVFYFGYNSSAIFMVALLIASLSVYFYFKRLNARKAYTFHGYAMIACVVVVACLLYAVNDLKKPIGVMDAKLLDSYYLSSTEYVSNGSNFRKAMSDLADKNGIVVSSQQSHIGTGIYTTYITKHDWNDLAKIYNSSNLPK